VSVLGVAQSSSEIPEGLMNNPVYISHRLVYWKHSVVYKVEVKVTFSLP